MTTSNINNCSMNNAELKEKSIYRILNFSFHGFHIVIIMFTLFGWAFKQTRLANFILICLTLGSWFILGRWLGNGYCPVTDWHWKIRRKINLYIPDSYIKLMLEKLSGKNMNSDVVNDLTLVFTLLSGTISLILNVLDWI